MITHFVEKYDNIDLSNIFRLNVKYSGTTCMIQIVVMFAFYCDRGSVDEVRVFYFGIPFCLLIFLSGLFVLIKHRCVKEIFKFHALIVLLMAASALIGSIIFALQGIPKGSFSWSFGLPTATTVYGIYLLRIGWLADWIDKYWFVKFSHVIAGVFVALLEGIILLYILKALFT